MSLSDSRATWKRRRCYGSRTDALDEPIKVPRIAICIPTLDRLEYLCEAVASAQPQPFVLTAKDDGAV